MTHAAETLDARNSPVPAAGQAPTLQVRRTTATDIDAHTDQLTDWSLRYDQLDGGVFHGGFTDIRWPGMQLFVETTSRRVRQRGHLPAGCVAIGIPIAGDGAVCLNGKHGGTDTLLAVHAVELDACTPANCTLGGLVVEAALLRDAAACAPELSGLLQEGSLLAMTSPETTLAPLRALLISVVEAALARPATLQDPMVQQRLRDDLLLHVVEAMAGAHRADQVHRADTRKRVVDRACELLLAHAHADEPKTLLEVCNQIGASPSKLGYCFQDVLGISPARYIKAMRLNAVRRELRRVIDPFTSVYDVAARWGFWHFGHFSSDYKRQFSELPSETLRCARSRDGASRTRAA